VFNGILNCFINFLAFRMMKDDGGVFFTADEAWDRLGIYGGDDGLTADLCPRVAEKAASVMGQKLKLEVVPRGHLGVQFLARRYGPDVWFGDSNSCCDILRQLSKFHLTVHLPSNITWEEKLADKAYSFYLTDRNTPIIGDFVRKVLTLYPLKSEDFRNLSDRWGIVTDEEIQYQNRRADWMQDLVVQQMATFDQRTFQEWLRRADKSTIRHPPVCMDPLPADPKPGKVVVGDDLVIIPEGKPVEPETPRNKQIAEKLRRYRARKPKSQRPSRLAATNNTSQ